MPHTMRRNKHTFLGVVRAMMRENCTMLTLLMAGGKRTAIAPDGGRCRGT